MARSDDKPRYRHWSDMRPHEEFLELCALSTTGELSQKERRRLEDHLETCSECREALKEFESAADVAAPLLFSRLSSQAFEDPESVPVHAINPTLSPGTALAETAEHNSAPTEQRRDLSFTRRDGRSRTLTTWKYAWVPLAAVVVLMVALGMYLYQFGRNKGQEIAHVTRSAADAQLEALEEQISDASHEREILKAQLKQRDRLVADLRDRVQAQLAALAEMKNTEAKLDQSLQNGETEQQRTAQEGAVLAQKLDASQASLQSAQKELDSLRQQRLQNEGRADSLEAQIRDLNGQLRDREQMLNKQQDLLAHDRDIRDLMGARDLYIAEVYDVARDGVTQKPYGRIFYTKGKSLIFYAYDLDEEPGVKNASTFQAWGRSGPDKQHALNLGIFYQDHAAKKRWVLKFDDPRMLEQIDAVFVTVEPSGGSHRPSGKPLLFASLKIEPNHP